MRYDTKLPGISLGEKKYRYREYYCGPLCTFTIEDSKLKLTEVLFFPTHVHSPPRL